MPDGIRIFRPYALGDVYLLIRHAELGIVAETGGELL
jgi:hypothetical protein